MCRSSHNNPQQQEEFNPYPTVDGKERSRQPKDFNRDKSKYKLWIQMVENYLLANTQQFPTDQLAILFAITYMTEGRAANWRTLYSPTYSRWTPPGVHLEFRQFFLGDNPANFLSRIHLESIWSPSGVQLASSCSIWTTWTPPQNIRLS